MAYSESPVTVQRMLPYLQPLIDGEGQAAWRVEEGRARRFAYRVREALYAAQLHPDLFPELAALEVRVAVVSRSHVQATLRLPEFVAEPLDEDLASSPRQTTVETTRAPGVGHILDLWHRRLMPEDKLYVPHANLKREELHKLWTHLQPSGAIFFEAAGALTILPLMGNEDSAPFAWNPEE
jgi:hypothetical protein